MLDDKDLRILSVLKQDARLSVRDIARLTRLRHSTVHQRIRRLVQDKVIERFTVKLGNKQVGESFIVFMFVSAEKHIPEPIFRDSHVKEVFGITGEYDLVLKLKFRDIEEFNEFILKFRRETGIKKTVTMVCTTTLKEDI